MRHTVRINGHDGAQGEQTDRLTLVQTSGNTDGRATDRSRLMDAKQEAGRKRWARAGERVGVMRERGRGRKKSRGSGG